MKLRALGGLRLEGINFTKPVPLLLLSYLVLNKGPQQREKLANLFWPYKIPVPKELSPLGKKLYFHLWEAWKSS